MQCMFILVSFLVKDCYEMVSIYKLYFGVGGDYYDYLEFFDGKFVFCIGDILGKGVVVVLLMVNFQVNFNILINKCILLKEFIIDFNVFVNWIMGGECFIIFFVVEFDCYINVLCYINVGYNLFILVSVN